MQGGTYQRATRRHPVRVDHTDGDFTEGYVLAPIGVSFDQALSQASEFLSFETEAGERTYLAMRAIKRVTHHAQSQQAGADRSQSARAEQPRRDGARSEQEEPEETASQNSQEESAPQERAQSARDYVEKRRREAAAREKAEKMVRDANRAFSEDDIAERQDILAHLKVLGVDRAAAWSEIQSAYRQQVKQYHPDRLRGGGATRVEIEAAASMLLRLNDSYQQLSRWMAEAA